MPNDLIVRIGADTSQAEAAFKKFRASAEGLANNLASSFRSVATQISGALAAAFSIKQLADFEEQVRAAAINSLEAVRSLGQFRQRLALIAAAASETGQNVAEAAGEFLNLGHSVEQLGALLISNSRAARALGVSTREAAAEIGRLAREWYGLEAGADAIERVASEILRLTLNTRAGARDIIEVFRGVIEVGARQAGLRFEEVAALIAHLTEFGTPAREIKNVLKELIFTLTANAYQFEFLGISVRTASGQLRPLIEIIEDLRDRMRALGLSPEQLAAFLRLPETLRPIFLELITNVERFRALLMAAPIPLEEVAARAVAPWREWINELSMRFVALGAGIQNLANEFQGLTSQISGVVDAGNRLLKLILALGSGYGIYKLYKALSGQLVTGFISLLARPNDALINLASTKFLDGLALSDWLDAFYRRMQNIDLEELTKIGLSNVQDIKNQQLVISQIDQFATDLEKVLSKKVFREKGILSNALLGSVRFDPTTFFEVQAALNDVQKSIHDFYKVVSDKHLTAVERSKKLAAAYEDFTKKVVNAVGWITKLFRTQPPILPAHIQKGLLETQKELVGAWKSISSHIGVLTGTKKGFSYLTGVVSLFFTAIQTHLSRAVSDTEERLKKFLETTSKYIRQWWTTLKTRPLDLFKPSAGTITGLKNVLNIFKLIGKEIVRSFFTLRGWYETLLQALTSIRLMYRGIAAISMGLFRGGLAIAGSMVAIQAVSGLLDAITYGIGEMWEKWRKNFSSAWRGVLDPILRSRKYIEKEAREAAVTKGGVWAEQIREMRTLMERVAALRKAGVEFVPGSEILPAIHELATALDRKIIEAELDEERKHLTALRNKLLDIAALAKDGTFNTIELANAFAELVAFSPEFESLRREFLGLTRDVTISLDDLASAFEQLNKRWILFRGVLYETKKSFAELSQTEQQIEAQRLRALHLAERMQRAQEMISEAMQGARSHMREQVGLLKEIVANLNAIGNMPDEIARQTFLTIRGVEANILGWRQIANVLWHEVVKGIDDYHQRLRDARLEAALLAQGFRGAAFEREKQIARYMREGVPRDWIAPLIEATDRMERSVERVKNAFAEMENAWKQSAAGAVAELRATVEALKDIAGVHEAIRYLWFKEQETRKELLRNFRLEAPPAAILGTREAYSAIIRAALQLMQPQDEQLRTLQAILNECRQTRLILQQQAQQ